ncbi:MAG: PIN domain-containing protein [Chloroflexi bacterium]|nr:PIN domain-containing protein [Chloroflexota bacterium]
MDKQVLLDTNVLIDVLANRKPFAPESQAVWDAHVNRSIKGYIAAISVTNFFYIIRRLTTKEEAWNGVHIILDTFAICDISAALLRYAAQLPGADLEDNVQIACAQALDLDAIVTRDKPGFQKTSIPILTPSELIAELGLKGEQE